MTQPIAAKGGKTVGLGKLPSQLAHLNAAWLELALTTADLPAWTQTVPLAGEDIVNFFGRTSQGDHPVPD